MAQEGDKNLIETVNLSFEEIIKHILWLESEIDLCLQYDLPTEHLEKELSEFQTIPEDCYLMIND